MAETTTMTIPPLLPVSTHHQSPSNRQTVSILAVAPTLSQTPSEAGATVYVASTTARAESPSVWRTASDVPASNYPAHVVKIKINPEFDNSRVISTVHLSPDDIPPLNDPLNDSDLSKSPLNLPKDAIIERNGKNLECVRINVNDLDSKKMVQKDDMNRSCFYYGSFQGGISTMVMSSGQCSPSDTLDSGTCSDLDGTPPPLPKKKGSSTVLLGSTIHKRTGSLSSGAEADSDDNESNISCDSLNSGELAALQHGVVAVVEDVAINQKTIKVPHEENIESIDNIESMKRGVEDMCLNNNHEEVNKNLNNLNDENDNQAEQDKSGIVNEQSSESGTSSLSKSSSTPRACSPNPLANGRPHASPVVKECTYEERKREQERVEMENAAAEAYANYKRESGNKYVYEDDRFYNFHVNELEAEEETRRGREDAEGEECFAGYKILDREAIRSAKGTVRGVKNRVRAGIATFLQNPSSKNYKQKDAGKVVVYTTSMRVVRKTTIACVKMLRILGTHMVQYEERDLFTSRQFQTELRDRLGCDNVVVPQLFIDGQYMGDADAVERLNESGELRPMLKPYKSAMKREVCPCCGGAGIIPCFVCNGSKKSPIWNRFMNEFVALRCMNCDVVGLTLCPRCTNL